MLALNQEDPKMELLAWNFSLARENKTAARWMRVALV
jgi:hypothetical protein